VRRILLVILVFLAAVAVWSGCRDEKTAPQTGKQALSGKATFVGSHTCRECHEERHESWLHTAHAYALRDPEPEFVAGDFNGKPIETPYFIATPYRKDGRYFIRIRGKDGRPDGDHQITRLVGRSFEQAYLTTSPTGRWLVMPLCWSLERKEWDLTHRVLEDIAGHVGGVQEDYDSRGHVFNDGCGQCHATDYDVGHDPNTGHLDSTFLEGAVACESCHGPGSVHEQWHVEGRGEESDDGYVWPARLVHPKKDLDAKAVLESCGRCHYVHEWVYAIDDDPRVGYDDIALSVNEDQTGFYVDGRLSGMNYHGSTQSQSACYLKGEMSCLSCHRMHGGKQWAMKWDGRSNRQCTQCHDAAERGAHHTHHGEDGDDIVRCVDCHMPKFLTGILHFLRDHAIRSPDPFLTEKYGADQSPNACNACHADKSAMWAREWREKWWGPGDAALRRDIDLNARLRANAAGVPTAELVTAVGRKQSGIFFRLTALTEIIRARRAEPAAQRFLRELLGSDNVELLQHAALAQTIDPDPRAAAGLIPLLRHGTRVVRLLAGYALLRTGWRGGHGADEAMKSVYADAKAQLIRQSHRVETLEQIALFADVVGAPAEADDYYARILRVGSGHPGRWRPQTLGLVQRKGRRATEAGRHAEALPIYKLAADAMAGRVSNLLRVDYAASLAAAGNLRAAVKMWQSAVAQGDRQGAPFVIAKARLDALAGREERALDSLRTLETLLAADPAGGDVLRRVRWSLRAIAPGR